MTTLTLAKPSTPACGAPSPTTTRSCSWARTSAPSAACSASPTGCRPSSAPTASSTRRCRGRDRRHRRRARVPRVPPGRRDPVRRVRLPGVRPDRRPGREAALPHRAATCACRSRSASRSAAASARPSTTPSRPRRTSRTRPACASSRARTPQDAYMMIRQAIACDDPVIFFEPKRRYHVKGEVDESASLADAPPMGVATHGGHRHATSPS